MRNIRAQSGTSSRETSNRIQSKLEASEAWAGGGSKPAGCCLRSRAGPGEGQQGQAQGKGRPGTPTTLTGALGLDNGWLQRNDPDSRCSVRQARPSMSTEAEEGDWLPHPRRPHSETAGAPFSQEAATQRGRTVVGFRRQAATENQSPVQSGKLFRASPGQAAGSSWKAKTHGEGNTPTAPRKERSWRSRRRRPGPLDLHKREGRFWSRTCVLLGLSSRALRERQPGAARPDAGTLTFSVNS